MDTYEDTQRYNVPPDEDDMFSEFVTDNPTDMENTPVNDKLDDLIREVQALRTELAPIAPFLAELPELMKKIGPFLDAAKDSPVLRMMGIKL